MERWVDLIIQMVVRGSTNIYNTHTQPTEIQILLLPLQVLVFMVRQHLDRSLDAIDGPVVLQRRQEQLLVAYATTVSVGHNHILLRSIPGTYIYHL